MGVREKLELFHTLVDIGVQGIEWGSPPPPRRSTEG